MLFSLPKVLVEAVGQSRKDWRDELKKVRELQNRAQAGGHTIKHPKPSEILAMQFSPDDFLLESRSSTKGDLHRVFAERPGSANPASTCSL